MFTWAVIFTSCSVDALVGWPVLVFQGDYLPFLQLSGHSPGFGAPPGPGRFSIST
jgi:hypothetical protein